MGRYMQEHHGKIHAGASYRNKDRRTNSASNRTPLGTIVRTSYRITVGREPVEATEDHSRKDTYTSIIHKER